jgi:hypothetical protein
MIGPDERKPPRVTSSGGLAHQDRAGYAGRLSSHSLQTPASCVKPKPKHNISRWPEGASNGVERVQLTGPPQIAGDTVRIAPRCPLSWSREEDPPGQDESTDHLYGTHFLRAGIDARIALGLGLIVGSAGRLGGRDKAGGSVSVAFES